MITNYNLRIALFALSISATTQLFGQIIPVKVLDSFYIFKQLLMSNQIGHPNIEIGCDSQKRNNLWLDDRGSYLQMDWKGGEVWGAVFFTSGEPQEDTDECKDNNRDFLDLSMYNYLLIDMKGNPGNSVEVGIKDKCNRNDGRETKILKQVTSNWATYVFPLDNFKRSDIKMIHVLVEFVYKSTPALIEVKNIRYVRGS